jgi:hypothetical protein
MKRYLIAIAALGLVLGANAALADSWAFDDPYWKAQETVGAVKAPETRGAPESRLPAIEHTPYYLVDDFNP